MAFKPCKVKGHKNRGPHTFTRRKKHAAWQVRPVLSSYVSLAFNRIPRDNKSPAIRLSISIRRTSLGEVKSSPRSVVKPAGRFGFPNGYGFSISFLALSMFCWVGSSVWCVFYLRVWIFAWEAPKTVIKYSPWEGLWLRSKRNFNKSPD